MENIETIKYLSTHEEWRDIQEYEGLYQVSSFGRVRGLDRVVKMKNGGHKTIKGRIIKESDNGHGYMTVTLRSGNKPHRFYVHRLVATAFLANDKGLPEINHKDEVKHHNNVVNLEWCDHRYNNTYGTKIARTVAHTDYSKRPSRTRKSINQAARTRSRLINVYDSESGEYYGSGFAKQLAAVLGLARTTITGYANGYNRNGQLTLKYADEDVERKVSDLTELPEHLSIERLRRHKSNKSALTLDELQIVCYDSLSGRLSIFNSIKRASEYIGLPIYKVGNGLKHKANGVKRYVFARHTDNYMQVLKQKYRKLKNKPINVYSPSGKLMFSDFNYNLARRFEVEIDYINKVARGEYKTVRGCRLEKKAFSPTNTLED